jgi:hypothetical protein
LEGEGNKAHTGRQNSVEACGELRISAAAGTNASDVHTISKRFAPGCLGWDPHLPLAATAHLGERPKENLTVPGSIPSLGILGCPVRSRVPGRRHGQFLRSDVMGGGTSLAWQGPHRVRQVPTIRTSPCGCDRPGSTPGADLFPSLRFGASQWAGIAAVPRIALANSYVEKPPRQHASIAIWKFASACKHT